MAHDVLHMVCLGTHPCGSCRIIVPVYMTSLEFTPWSSTWQFVTLLSGCLKPFPCPLPIYTRVRFLFSQDQKKNFLPLLYGCLRPFLLPSSNHNTLEFVFNVLVFRVWSLSPSPLRKVASHSGLPQNIQWELKMTGLSTLGKRGRWMKS